MSADRLFHPALWQRMPLEPRGAPMPIIDGGKCESTLQIGFFFDGTGNNRELHQSSFADTNVARLYAAYPHRRELGLSRVYIPGVGTPCRELEEPGESWQGAAYGKGCEARVLLGLLSLLDEVYRHAISNRPLFTNAQLALLCTRTDLRAYERRKLAKFNQEYGLVEGEFGGTWRLAFMKNQAKYLEHQMACRVYPTVKRITVDVFGFSRGAACARVFCTWLNQVVENGTFAGIPIEIRFLGIFDTVAAAGLGSMITGVLSTVKDGHDGWANEKSLQVSSLVRNCVHFVAMHEFRRNFPLDEIAAPGGMPAGSLEIAYPGSHSDVGGGYAPGELGIAAHLPARQADCHKLSQITLNHMFDYAVSCGVPLSKSLSETIRPSFDSFAIANELKSAFDLFVSEIGPELKPIYCWARDYLAWRWSVSQQYNGLAQVRMASAEQRAMMEKSNRKLIDDATLLRSCGDPKFSSWYRDYVSSGKHYTGIRKNLFLCADLDDLDREAPVVMKDAVGIKPSPSMAKFFDTYVHDSYAGFAATHMEPTGYWRYRRSFRGTNVVRFAIEADAEVAASG
jgi:hypothetical protein